VSGLLSGEGSVREPLSDVFAEGTSNLNTRTPTMSLCAYITSVAALEALSCGLCAQILAARLKV
jgi:hypothetical protein